MKFISYLKPCFLIKKSVIVTTDSALSAFADKKNKLIKLQFFHNERFHEYLLKLESMNQIASKKRFF